jgi:Short C-terminal domain
MPPRRRGRPGLMGTMARTAVVAGTATVVAGSVSQHSAQKASQQQQAAAAQQQQAAAAQQQAAQQQAAQQQAMIDQAAAQAAAQTAAQLQAQQAAAQPAAPPAAGPDDRMAKIKELGEMKSQGLLTEEEFAAEKARILAT